MNYGNLYTARLLLLLVLAIGVTQASQFSRDESQEDDKTEFNLASTFKGGITSNRHHARAHLNSQLYPGLAQQPSQPVNTVYGSEDIDTPSAHENGGSASSAGSIDARLGAAGNRMGSIYPALPPPTPVAYPTPAYPVSLVQPQIALPVPSAPPSYPGQYRPQYQAQYQPQVLPQYQPQYQPQVVPQVVPPYPQYAQVVPYPVYPGYPVAQPPPQSYQNQQQQQYAPAAPPPRDHLNHSFAMNTEYKEDGVHTGPFEVLNNHNKPGYGSGFGHGYNGAFNRPGY